MKRQDDYETRRKSVAELSDAELEARFWELAGQLVDPMLKMGYENTTPAIERSVLLRMGFSSVEAKAIVTGCTEHSLMGHGAGNVVYKLSKSQNMELRDAGLALIQGRLWNEAENLFKEDAQ